MEKQKKNQNFLSASTKRENNILENMPGRVIEIE
jgi:hypothetical protein